jgi:hypothetical protein
MQLDKTESSNLSQAHPRIQAARITRLRNEAQSAVGDVINRADCLHPDDQQPFLRRVKQELEKWTQSEEITETDQ